MSEHILNEFQTTQCPVECVRANVDLEDGVLVCSACGAEVDERRS